MKRRKPNPFPDYVRRSIEREVTDASIRRDERVKELWKEKYGDLEFDLENEQHQERWIELSGRIDEEEGAHGGDNG